MLFSYSHYRIFFEESAWRGLGHEIVVRAFRDRRMQPRAIRSLCEHLRIALHYVLNCDNRNIIWKLHR
jgi:hypothetical protein